MVGMARTKTYHREVWNNLRSDEFAYIIPPSQLEQVNRLISDGIRGNWSKEHTLAIIKRELVKGKYHVHHG